jgi:hypothetical protein
MGMLYSKPKNLKYTDMCIFFDENFWLDTEEFDEVTCYKYLYTIIYMLASKKKLLRLYSDYDSFVMFASTTVYMRMLRRKREKREKIKSILNYLNSCLKHIKNTWQGQEYSQQISADDDEVDIEVLKDKLRENVSTQYSHHITEAVIDSFKEIPGIIQDVIKGSPYSNDKVMIRNIELSCLITMYKSFMLSKRTMKNLKASNEVNINLFNMNKENSLTLFRLDESMRDTINVLCNKCRKAISEKISKEISENTLDNNTLDDILETAWEATTHQLNSDNMDWEESN